MDRANRMTRAIEAIGCTALVLSVLLWNGISRAAMTSPLTEMPAIQFFGGAHEKSVGGIASLMLPEGAHIRIPLERSLSTKSGTLIAWVMPLWNRNDGRSHVFMTLPWQGNDSGYLALSQGWWEPNGRHTLHFILNNKDGSVCYPPGEFNYTFFLPNQWTMMAMTWDSGIPSYVRLYVDGQKLCDRPVKPSDQPRAGSNVFIGSDLGASDQRNRASEFALSRFEYSDLAMNDAQIAARYRSSGGSTRRKWTQSLLEGDVAVPHDNERRVMFDEDPHWVDSPLEIQQTIKRVKAAGFNTYVPCVWNGAESLFDTALVPVAPRYRAARRSGYDPLRYLIEFAHAEGIEVHLWFHVVRRASNSFSPALWAGAPDGAFNIHAPPFRAFAVQLIADTMTRYDVDGVNLDYIRSIGICTSNECSADYRRQFNRGLAEDWRAHQTGTRVASLIEWQSAALSKLVFDAAKKIRTIKPNLMISVDTVVLDQEREHQGVSVQQWIKQGAVDLVFHMAYETPIDVAQVTEVWKMLPVNKLVVLLKNYEHVDGKVVSTAGEVLADNMQLVRKRWPGSSLGVYHYPRFSADQMLELRRKSFGDSSSVVH